MPDDRCCTIELVMDNDAFADAPMVELARILRHTADRIELAGHDEGVNYKLYDVNGNKVGTCHVDEREEDEVEQGD